MLVTELLGGAPVTPLATAPAPPPPSNNMVGTEVYPSPPTVTATPVTANPVYIVPVCPTPLILSYINVSSAPYIPVGVTSIAFIPTAPP